MIHVRGPKTYVREVRDGYEWFSFSIGRYHFDLFCPLAIGEWYWKQSGYDCLWDEYSFGFFLQVSRETDYLLGMADG